MTDIPEYKIMLEVKQLIRHNLLKCLPAPHTDISTMSGAEVDMLIDNVVIEDPLINEVFMALMEEWN